MVKLLNIFYSLLNTLRQLKAEEKISKFSLDITSQNTVNIVVVSNIELDKEHIGDEDFEFLCLSPKECDTDSFYSDIFKKSDEIINYKNSRRKLTNLLDSNSNYSPNIPIITYYSYKGGMGRSTNLVMSATHLARHFSKKVVIIDCDFEAPGFSNFFLENPNAPYCKNGVIEYFFDSDIDEDINLNNYSWEVSKEFSKDGEIHIIPAGNLSIESNSENELFKTDLNHYLEGLSRIDFASTEYIVNKFENLINLIEKQLNPDVIFIDSRTGFTDIFGITALKLASHIVGLFSNSAQNLPGIYQFIDSVKNIPSIKSEFRVILINAFSDSDFFEEFKSKVDDYITTSSSSENDDSDNLYFFSPEYFYFRYNLTLSELGTSRERKKNWLEQVDDKEFSKGYVDVAERLNTLINEYNYTADESKIIESALVKKDEYRFDIADSQKNILTALDKNWPNLYADSGSIDYTEEFEKGRFFFRDSMKDLFNFSKFLVIGNKGTGKSYLFQALKSQKIVEELKKNAQKSHLTIDFLHVVDKTENYFINTNGFDSFKKDIEGIGNFYDKFWKIYTWKGIVDKHAIKINFTSGIFTDFNIKNNDTETLTGIIKFASDIDNIIHVEKELEEIDKLLNSKQLDIVAIYDNLDLMVDPVNWKFQIAPLINFWQYSNYKRIHSKLFLRTDLYKKVKGLNNSQELVNKTIYIEWGKEEIFNYFFNLVKVCTKEDFINAVNNFNFEKISGDSTGWISDFQKKFNRTEQRGFDEYTLRRLCWVFFGQYPDIKAHGESYDWLYKNVMNADETISLRPFIDLLSLSITEYLIDANKDTTAILPNRYYTSKKVRKDAVDNHFKDLVSEIGNKNLEHIFDFIDNHNEFKYFEFYKEDFNKLLSSVITENSLKESISELEELLIINGIVRKIPIRTNTKYTFAFLYKYRLGLGNRRGR